VKPNCGACPKLSPDNESRYRLTPKNRRAYETWKALGDNWPAGWADDDIWVRNCQIIAEAVRFHEQNQSIKAENRFAVALAAFKKEL
jgi:hypothetical protein